MAARYGIQWTIKKYGKKAVSNAIKSNTHKVAKGINSSPLTSKGVDIGKFTQKVRGKNQSIEILKLDGLFQKIKGSLMEDLIGNCWIKVVQEKLL